MTDDEKLFELEAALLGLVLHDRAADLREDTPSCIELDHAEYVLINSCGYTRGKSGLLLVDWLK